MHNDVDYNDDDGDDDDDHNIEDIDNQAKPPLNSSFSTVQGNKSIN